MSALHDQELADTLQAVWYRRKLASPPIPRRLRGRCVYCGGWTRGRACQAHKDLPQLDPYYNRDTGFPTGTRTPGKTRGRP